jgi:hypothetical protein
VTKLASTLERKLELVNSFLLTFYYLDPNPGSKIDTNPWADRIRT